ncbi:YbjN domain-containing protein [Verrucomicrobia bacterium]|nr:YbjN domain-containing protein [Verrucomicrobiota bacterium]
MTKATTEQDLYIKIKEAFNSASWEFREIPDKRVIEAEFEAHHAKVPLHAQSFEELMAISVVSRLSFSILPKSMRSALDALMRTNITLNLGNFEANPVSGEVYFRITNVFPDYNFNPDIVTSLVRVAIVEMDRVTPFLSELNKNPNQPIAQLLERKDLLPEFENKGS